MDPRVKADAAGQRLIVGGANAGGLQPRTEHGGNSDQEGRVRLSRQAEAILDPQVEL